MWPLQVLDLNKFEPGEVGQCDCSLSFHRIMCLLGVFMWAAMQSPVHWPSSWPPLIICSALNTGTVYALVGPACWQVHATH